jgi:hypothetical protein
MYPFVEVGVARWCRTGPDGSFRTAPLPAGEYQASAHDPVPDRLAGREREGDPLGACVLPQKVAVGEGKVPKVVLRAVPHVSVEIRLRDGNGKPAGEGVLFEGTYEFEGKLYWSIADHSAVRVRDGRATFRVPHGTTQFQFSYMPARPSEVYARRQPAPRRDDVVDHGRYTTVKNLNEDVALDYELIRGVEAIVRVSTKDGSAPRQLALAPGSPEPGDVIYGPVVPVGDGVYWLWGVMPDVQLTVVVSALDWEPVFKTVTPKRAAAPQPIEVILEKRQEKKE